VATVLEEAGLEVRRGLAGTGVVGTLRVGNGARAIGMRADMDALAMAKTADRPYKSTADGKIHACGHDGHIAMLLGAARHLAATRRFSGVAHFIFQPAEEGRGGAKRMVEDELFDLFPCDAVYGLHNMPGLATNEMAVVEGPQLASSDNWRLTLRGVGAHGAKPHLGKDPITAAGTFLSALQTIVGRVIDPLHPAVISACSLHAGNSEALNVISDVVQIGGTARAYTPEVRDILEEAIGRLARGAGSMHGVESPRFLDFDLEGSVGGEDRAVGADLFDRPIEHDNDAIGQSQGLGLIVSNEDHRYAGLLLDPLQLRAHSRRRRASRLDRGSSSRRTFGSITMERASATRCC
jgi:amidohydrolase